jgi:hypothetical protein
MQTILAEQQNKDWERIKFRQEEYERKRQELQERHQMEEHQEIQREERLQALADRVRPHIEIDHARVLQPTQVIISIQLSKHTDSKESFFFRHIMLIVVY